MPATSSATTATFRNADPMVLRRWASRRAMPCMIICAKSPFALLLPGLMGLYPILYAHSTRMVLSLYVSCGRLGDIWSICYLMPALLQLYAAFPARILSSSVLCRSCFLCRSWPVFSAKRSCPGFVKSLALRIHPTNWQVVSRLLKFGLFSMSVFAGPRLLRVHPTDD